MSNPGCRIGGDANGSSTAESVQNQCGRWRNDGPYESLMTYVSNKEQACQKASVLPENPTGYGNVYPKYDLFNKAGKRKKSQRALNQNDMLGL
ncbi:hypothetical protein [Citrobacter sp. Cb004]|uniref:hypothetical protein n=1 Tax=Citrobacter sp. Cb004 TaxID=2985006 RepID=UPI002575DBC0|nr:hypothetical protein [Citrobacter sp. Cb004]MDM3354960.1 hypothetical protein [Citrobacter sp. Cb004]